MHFEIQRLRENENATCSGVLRPKYLAKSDFGPQCTLTQECDYFLLVCLF